MLYSPSTKIAFLHIHKTAGVSAIRALQHAIPDMTHLPELPEAHYRLPELFRVLESRGEDPHDAKVVTIICHPLAHAVSIYEYWRSDRVPHADRKLRHVAQTRKLDFVCFLDQVLDEDQFAQHLLVDGKLPDNVTILRRETLGRDLEAFIRDAIGRDVPVEVPVLNRTPHAPVRSYATGDVLAKIAKVYAWTFAQGYYDPAVLPEEPEESGLLADGQGADSVVTRGIARARRFVGRRHSQ